MMRPVKCPPDCPGRHRRGEDQQLQFSHFAIASLAPPSAEIPKSKFQIPNNLKFLSRSVGRDPALRVDFLSLELGISLELGAWDLGFPFAVGRTVTLLGETSDARLSADAGRRACKPASLKYRRGRAFPG